MLPGLWLAALAWFAALLAAPLAVERLPPGHPAFRAAAAVYAVGSVVCHQRPDRSLRVRGLRLPVCGRCAGLYAGVVLGLALATLWPRGPARRLVDRWERRGRWRLVLALVVLPAALSWLAEWTGALPAGAATPVRASTGVVLGAGIAWALGLSLDAWLARQPMR